jgi:hypothetical protein
MAKARKGKTTAPTKAKTTATKTPVMCCAPRARKTKKANIQKVQADVTDVKESPEYFKVVVRGLPIAWKRPASGRNGNTYNPSKKDQTDFAGYYCCSGLNGQTQIRSCRITSRNGIYGKYAFIGTILKYRPFGKCSVVGAHPRLSHARYPYFWKIVNFCLNTPEANCLVHRSIQTEFDYLPVVRISRVRKTIAR